MIEDVEKILEQFTISLKLLRRVLKAMTRPEDLLKGKDSDQMPTTHSPRFTMQLSCTLTFAS